jgi:hypothetical protein
MEVRDIVVLLVALSISLTRAPPNSGQRGVFLCHGAPTLRQINSRSATAGNLVRAQEPASDSPSLTSASELFLNGATRFALFAPIACATIALAPEDFL